MKSRLFAAVLAGTSVFALAACEDANRDGKTGAVAPAAAPATPAVAPAQPGVLDVAAVNSATFAPPPAEPEGVSPVLAKAQVLLDRAGFSPGVIDARYGENVRLALEAFQEARGLPGDGALTAETFAALEQVGGPPAFARYTITAQDVAGPFNSSIPEEIPEKAKLQHLGYTSAAELIAERFHMDEQLLRALNPGVDFRTAGVSIHVANPARPALAGTVARLEVDKEDKALRAYDEAGTLLAYYPATIGSAEQPSPSGSMKVNGVARNPTFTYDPKKLDYNKDIKTKTTVAAGPNNPVGLVWIDLSKPTYGIHGSPEPDVIGKTQSNGCVRLSNWDALHLAAAVKPGVRVQFV